MKIYGTIKEIVPELFKQLDMEEKYVIEIKKPKSKRSLEQNRLLWALINEIAKKQYQDEMEVYIQALEEANAKFTWLKGLKETKEELLKVFRAVKLTRYDEDGLAVFKCFYGSSKMNTKEMSELLDIIIGWASELGIPIQEDFY